MSINYYSEHTNLMAQYLENKEKCLDTFMLFRIGDFYEAFFDDAIQLSRLLGLHLTQRSNHGGAPMCGLPHAHKDKFVQKIIQEGFKVTICEQVEDPALTSGRTLVKREIIQTITPGTITSDEVLDQKSHNYIACVSKPGDTFGIAVCDLTTGDFSVTEIIDDTDKLLSELSAYSPAEIVFDNSIRAAKGVLRALKMGLDPVLSCVDENIAYADFLEQQISNLPKIPHTSKHTSGMLYHYLDKTQKGSLAYVSGVKYYVPDEYMVLDVNTRRNLELVESNHKTRMGSLLWAIDDTETSMGSRLLRSYLNKPCVNKKVIEDRLDSVDYLVAHPKVRADIREVLCEVSDIERLTGRATYNSASARDIVKIANALEQTPKIKHILLGSGVPMLMSLADQLHEIMDLVGDIKTAIVNNPPVTLKEGGVIRDGYSEKLDSYRRINLSGSDWITTYQQKLQNETGIKKLKIVFNLSLGYYIEIPRSQSHLMPREKFERTQELTSTSRYKTEELIRKQNEMNEASASITDLEHSLFVAVRDKVIARAADIKEIAVVLATVDVLQSFAETSVKHKYVRPSLIDNSKELVIKKGRHPVIEQGLLKVEYTSNDTEFSSDMTTMMITGPNMAGKSTYMRQVAVISLLAHLGSHVPAEFCEIPVMDRIFTRIGASDNLYGGDSTFMLEMKDIKTITDEATDRSLVIIDELGRGTSVTDGTAIAQSVIEFLHNQVQCKSLVSTHYYSLTELSQVLERLKNFHMMANEDGETITFLHRLSEGVATSSYGIYCAEIAGIKSHITVRAKQLAKELESEDKQPITVVSAPANIAPVVIESPPIIEKVEVIPKDLEDLRDKITKLDISGMTPMDALIFLNDLNKKLRL